MVNEMPVTIRGDKTTQLKGVAATIQSMPLTIGPSLMPLLCNQIPIDRSFADIVFVNAVPKAMPWRTERVGGAILTIKQQITAQTYSVAISVNADDYDDDQVDAYKSIIQNAMQSLLLAPDELITTQIILNGTSINGYDGVAFYGSTHAWPNGEFKTNQSNLVTKSGDDAASIETDFFTARNNMMKWLDDKGRVKNPARDFDGEGTLVVHHPVAISQAVQAVFGITKGGDAFDLQPNTDQTKFARKSQLAGSAIMVPDAYFDANGVTDGMYIHSVKGTGDAKPFAFLDRTPPFVEIFTKGSEYTAINNEVLILGKRRFGLGVLRPERTMKVA